MSTVNRPPGRQDRELLPQDSPLARYISVNPGRMSGEPCFKGTRVPVQTLFDYLSAGDSLEKFLDGFPDVSREQAAGVIELGALGLLSGLRGL
jgi:uncharacterized protein (DUF433 family)